jgi:hypothetical protein
LAAADDDTIDTGIFTAKSTKKVERQSVIESDLWTAVDLASLALRIYNESNTETECSAALWQVMRANGMNEGKPKHETIEISKLFTKIRSIKVGQAYMQMQLGMLCTAFARRMKNVTTDGMLASNGNMYSWTPVHGGMHSLITQLFTLDQKVNRERYFLFYYSDNVYVWDVKEKELWSLDVAKMESTSTVAEGMAIVNFMWVHTVDLMMEIDDLREDGVMYLPGTDSAVRAAMRHLLQAQGSVLNHDVICQRGHACFRALGLSTGSASTFLDNHLRMASSRPEMQTVFNSEHEGVTHFEQSAKNALAGESKVYSFPSGAMVPFDLEFTATTSPSAAGTELHEVRPPEGGYPAHLVPSYMGLQQAMDNPGTLDRFGPMSRTDLLGFDTTFVIVTEEDGVVGVQAPFVYAVGALSWDRVWKIIMFRKTDIGGKEKTDMPSSRTKMYEELVGEFGVPVASAVDASLVAYTNLSAVYSAYAMGGFAYKDTHDQATALIHFLVRDIYKKMSEVYATVNHAQKELLLGVIGMAAKKVLVSAINDFLPDEETVEEMSEEGMSIKARTLARSIALMRGEITSTEGADGLAAALADRRRVLLELHLPRSPTEPKKGKEEDRGRSAGRSQRVIFSDSDDDL